MAMSGSDSLIVERPSGDITVLKINRPQVRNALNLEVRTRLADEITRCGADTAVRCIIVTGSDAAFAAGADIGEMAEAGPVEVMSRNVQKYWRTIMDCPKPVIAAVEGFALGGGLELALCADIIVAGEDGVVVVPSARAAEVLQRSQEIDDRETKMVPFIKQFKSLTKAIEKFNRI